MLNMYHIKLFARFGLSNSDLHLLCFSFFNEPCLVAVDFLNLLYVIRFK